MKAFFHKYFVLLSSIGMILLIALDQWTKKLAVSYLKGKEPFVIWNHVFEFHYFENRGAAWGILEGQQVFFYILTIVFCVLMLYEVFRLHKNVRYMPFVYTILLMLAGAVGNLIDRVVNQYVVDFIYVKLINFPIFNLADCYITISVFVMVLLMFFYYSDEEFEEIFPLFLSKKKLDTKQEEK